MKTLIRNFKASQDGASAAEYALIIALVGVGVIAGASLLGTNINNRLSQTAVTISNAK
jgi:pilus assembly protein Flp/PilA